MTVTRGSRAPARVGAARPRAGCTARRTAALTPLGRSQGRRGSRHRQLKHGEQTSASPLQCERRITPCLVLLRDLVTLRIETSSSLPSVLAALTGVLEAANTHERASTLRCTQMA
eukprot:3030-Heterococcus_DN1.PRE.4